MAANHRVTINLEDREYAELSALSDKYRVSLAWLGPQGNRRVAGTLRERGSAASAEPVLRETPRGALKPEIPASWRRSDEPDRWAQACSRKQWRAQSRRMQRRASGIWPPRSGVKSGWTSRGQSSSAQCPRTGRRCRPCPAEGGRCASCRSILDVLPCRRRPKHRRSESESPRPAGRPGRRLPDRSALHRTAAGSVDDHRDGSGVQRGPGGVPGQPTPIGMTRRSRLR